MVPDAVEVLRETIWSGLRFAPAVFSGRIIFKRAMPERLRTLRHCIFTGGGVKVNGICSAAFCESAALRQTFRLNCKVTGFARGFPFEERLPPLRGKMSRSDKRGDLSPQVTERAHSYSFIVTEPSGYFHRFCGISRPKAGKSDTCAGRHLWNFRKNLFFSHFSVIIVRYDILHSP